MSWPDNHHTASAPFHVTAAPRDHVYSTATAPSHIPIAQRTYDSPTRQSPQEVLMTQQVAPDQRGVVGDSRLIQQP